ncbi:MAG: hypothetical protein Q7R63_00535, partial [bacterium]|nr:hypothetical protein [bacterium]
MKKINILTCVFGMGLVVACAGVSFASAQTVYPQRVLIQRQSLLGQYVSFFNWFGFKAPNPAPVDNPYGLGVTNAPVQRGPVAQPGSFGPVANGFSPTTLGPVRKGGSCASCNAGYDLKDGNCVA